MIAQNRAHSPLQNRLRSKSTTNNRSCLNYSDDDESRYIMTVNKDDRLDEQSDLYVQTIKHHKNHSTLGTELPALTTQF